VDDAESAKLLRENAYLKLRCAQLQGDVTDLASQVGRLQQELERVHAVRERLRADPIGPPG
jgi:L-alanine-DL-glutamate epimerase-like enolase superfamily enzyme